MAFFRNSSINLLNLHYGIHWIVETGGGAFYAIYLLKSGVPVPGVFVSLALILLGRLVIRPVVIGFAFRWGLRRMVVAGTVLSALQYPLLAEVRGVGVALIGLIAIAALGGTVYWSTYHAYFAALGDDDVRGQQIGAREAIAALVGVASPLLWTPEAKVGRQVPGVFRAAVPGMLLFVADGWVAAGYVFVWQIALFVSLGENFLAYGGALAFAAVVGAVGGLTLGRHIDAGRGKQAVWYAFGTFALIVVLRAVAIGRPAIAVLANALGAFGECLYIPALMTPIYTMAKRSPCTLRFHVATEGGWDVGGATGLLAAALATGLGVSLSASILQSLAGVAVIIIILRRYYANRLPSMVGMIGKPAQS